MCIRDSNYSFLNSSDPTVIEGLYKQFRENPDQLDPSWKQFFEGFDFAAKNYKQAVKKQTVTSAEFKVLNLIDDYRKRGHLFTETNPVRKRRNYKPSLAIENYGLTDKDLDTVFEAGIEIGIGPAPLKKIVETLQLTYCRSFGAEFMYIRQPEIVDWLLKKMETIQNLPALLKVTNDTSFKNLIEQ